MTMRNIIFTLLTVLVSCECYKILGFSHIPVGSHNILATRLFTELAKKGHEVTFLTPFASKSELKNLKIVPVVSLQDVTKQKSLPFFDLEGLTPLQVGKYIMSVQFALTEHLLKSEQMQKILHSGEKYDAVIIYQYLNDATQSIGHYFKVPVILFSSMPMYVPENFLLSYPTTPAYVPNMLTEYTGRMNFWQRLRNTFYDVTLTLYYLHNYLPKQRELVHKYVAENLDLYTFLNNASLSLINAHVSATEAVPLVPNAIEIGGYHIDPKPLPEGLKKFLDDSPNGVILFSMGTIARSVDFPKEKVDVLIKTFSKLKMNVLWKWEDDALPGLPSNVKIMKWIPQSDVLGHPNVKVFISHGGLLSTTEAIYWGVPIVGIPLTIDQKMNIAQASSYEYAVHVPYQELTEEKLTLAIDQALNNPKYKENVKKRSNIMRDRPMKPQDSLVYWTEYVIRHQGAPHLRYPGMDLNWFQRNLLDVVAFVLVAAFTVIIFIFFIVKKIVKQFSANGSKRKRE